MNKITITYLFILFFSSIKYDVCFSQDSTDFRTKENYSLALEYYSKKALDNPQSNYFLFKTACYYSLVDSVNKSFEHLSIAIDKGIDFTFVLADSDFENLRRQDKWVSIETQLKNRYLLNNKQITNLNLSYFIMKAYVEDQKYRSLRSLYKLDTFPKNHSIIINQNIQTLLDTIKLKGWPLFSQVGVEAGNYAFYIFQHSDNSIMKKVLPLLLKAAKNEQADKTKAAMMIDRFLLNHYQPQIYGTQIISFINNKNESFLYKTVDEKNLNVRRQQLGMKPIEQYCEEMGVKYIPIEERTNFKNRRIRKSWKRKGYFLE